MQALPRSGGGCAIVNSVSDCQKHTLYYQCYYCSTSRIGGQPSAKFTNIVYKVHTILVLGTGWRSVCTLIIILKCDKAIFNTFGSLRGFSHVIMEVDCMEHSPQFSLNSGSDPSTNRSARQYFLVFCYSACKQVSKPCGASLCEPCLLHFECGRELA